MRYATIQGIRFDGVCACVPADTVDNVAFGAGLFGEEIENAVRSTGVRTRRVCPPGGVTALDLAVRAAKTLLDSHSLSPGEVGGVLFITQTPDHNMPNNASRAAYLLGLPTACVATDASLACSGYVYVCGWEL